MNAARPASRNTGASNKLLFISVVMPVRNEAAFIAETLNDLLSQDYPVDRFEILVVDGQSTDNTRNIVSEFATTHANVKLLDNPKMWSSAARNIGIQEAAGEIVAIIDGHCDIPNNRYLANLSRAFCESDADVVGRPQLLNVENATPTQQAIAIVRASRLGHHPDSFIYSSESQFVPASSVGTAYRREVFDQIGLFDETFDACEDVDFNTRIDLAKKRCYFTPDVGIKYYPRASLRGLFTQMVRYGRGRVRLTRKHPKTASLKTFIPGIFVAGLVLGPLMAAFHFVFAIAFAVSIVTYILIVAMTSGWLAICNRCFGHCWRLPIVFATVHVGSGWGIVKEFLLGRSLPRETRSV